MPLDCLLPSGQPSQSGSELDHISQSAIDPLYRLDRVTQLKVIEALLDPIFEVDDLLREHFLTATKAAQPIHVFIDASNIIIGFYGKIKQARYIPIDSRIRIPSFFFEGFATAIERGRPCAKRIFAGSMKPGASTPNYMSEAASLGYEMNILQRVKGSKKTRSQYDMIVPGVYIPESFDHSHREQGVDEILQLKMMHTLIDTAQPGTMVVATGDAAEAEFSDGFHKCVVRALQLGWLVEVVGFRENMSSAWFANDFMKKWALQLRIFTLDNLVEEFLTPYYS
ncbi:hypothetical protein BD289DRAFT_368658 [Coniella lustricola]|uniref:NYN domain-containing protein n=1 Tax=Coniella lustricola TaxID=2025994 RepID=A0A2T3A7M4_9PEZI|nr:hypothetical protein BD289DRAFT_368658 [Coniella lustricola]